MTDKNSVREKTIVGLLWSFLDLMSNHGSQFILQIIIARILLPEHFGLIGMTLLFIAISNTIIDSGFTQALIRDQHTTQQDYSTIFFFNIIVSIIVYGILYFTAPLISNFYSEPHLSAIIRVLGITIIISAFGMIQKTMLMKKIDFRTITVVSLVASIVSGVVTIVMAYLGYGVWSLVVNIIALQFVQTILFCCFNKWVPSWAFRYASFQKYYKFGYKLLLASLIDTFYNNLFFLIIGKMYSTAQLGYYTNAVKFRDIAAQSLAATVQRVSYPVLSSIQDDEEKLSTNFRTIIKVSAFINFPLMVGLIAIAPSLFLLVLGDKWAPSIGYFQLLCLAGIIYPLHAINLNILQVKGRSDLFLFLEVLKKTLLTMLILVSFLLKLGIWGLICAAVINSYISLLINTFYSAREISYSTFDQVKDLLPIFLISSVMGVVVFITGSLIPDIVLLKMCIQIIIGSTCYIAVCKLVKIQELSTVFQMIATLTVKFVLYLKENMKTKPNSF